MKFGVVLTLILVVVSTLATVEVDRKQEIDKTLLSIAELETDSANDKNINVQRSKRGG